MLPHQSPNLVQVKVNSAIYSREETSPSWCLIMLSDGRREDTEAPEIYVMLMLSMQIYSLQIYKKYPQPHYWFFLSGVLFFFF